MALGTGSLQDNLNTSTRETGTPGQRAIAVVNPDGSNISGGGGGGSTQYTEGDTDASITGNAVLWEDASDTLRPVSTVKPLPIQATAIFSAPFGSDAFSVEYPSATQEVYKFRSGGIAGTVLKTVTLNYTNATKKFLLNGAES